jgi:hypothetical protein
MGSYTWPLQFITSFATFFFFLFKVGGRAKGKLQEHKKNNKEILIIVKNRLNK